MDAIEEIKSRLDIVDLISEYLPLKPAGTGSFKAACPFHQERTPSFFVSRNRQSWHCFGCHEGGDVFSFVQKIEGMEFREALILLAEKTGVQLPVFDAKTSEIRQRLYVVNDLASRFFRAALLTWPQAEVARLYLHKRGVDDLTADLFRLGYAPELWTGLTDALLKKGCTAEELIKSGLSIAREHGQGLYDRFRNRLMFPIMDLHGRVIGFTGRQLSDEKKEAKYVNTSETAIYHKSFMLYGLDKAKGEIRRSGVAVLVEGNMDVISSHQFGVTNVVAASGTALTREQLGLLRRFTQTIAVAFDQDAAGTAASLRSLDLARQEDFSVRMICLPPDAGKDPDEIMRKDLVLWKTAIEQAVSIMEWVYRLAFRGRDRQKPEDKKLIAKDVLMEIGKVADPVERDYWVKKLAEDLDVREETLFAILEKRPVPRQSGFHAHQDVTSKEQPVYESVQRMHEKQCMALLLSRPGIFLWAMQECHACEEDFVEPDIRELYSAFRSCYDHGQSTIEACASTLSDSQAKLFQELAFIAERDFVECTLEELQNELKTSLLQKRDLNKAQKRKELELAMREAERQGDAVRVAKLVEEFSRLLHES